MTAIDPGPVPGSVDDGAGPAVGPTSPRAWRALWSTPSGAVGAMLTGLVLLGSVLAWLGLLPFDPIAQHAADRLQGPSGTYWAGTDQFGRDVFSRVLAGAAGSLRVAVVAVAISTVIGVGAGLAAGYFGGAVRAPVLAVTNVLFAFPPLLLALALATAFSRNWFTIAVAIAVVYVPIFVRVARGPVLSLREVDFVRAAVVVGMPTRRILLREILPNITGVVIVQVTLSLSWAVLTEASLSFLGLGTPPPAPSLGSMIYESRVLVSTAWWTMIAPGAVIFVFVIGLNLLGDGLRDVLDPATGGTPMTTGRPDLSALQTEEADPAFADIDTLEVAELVRLMNRADRAVPVAVEAALGQIIAAVEDIADRLGGGGRLLYVGAGSAGRLGVLDASEIPPTFSAPADQISALLAGGPGAMFAAVEGAEDDPAAGSDAIAATGVGTRDAVVGIAASGRTPYVLGALREAAARGALTVSLCCTSPAAASALVDRPIEVLVGPEVVAGSTRLKAGTAQKMVLNMISTIAMVRLGKTYGSLMVDLRATNAKLAERAIGMVASVAGTDRATAENALLAADLEVKLAIVMLRTGDAAHPAKERLGRARGRLRVALADAAASGIDGRSPIS